MKLHERNLHFYTSRERIYTIKIVAFKGIHSQLIFLEHTVAPFYVYLAIIFILIIFSY